MEAETKRQRLGRTYDRFGGLVFRRAMKLLQDEAGARDTCHEVFAALLRDDGPLYRPDDELLAWLYRATTNHCLNDLRNRRRRTALLAAGEAPALMAATGLPLGLLLRGMPEDLQPYAIFYYIDEMTQQEIAEVMSVSQRTVCGRLQELRAFLDANFSETKAAVKEGKLG